MEPALRDHRWTEEEIMSLPVEGKFELVGGAQIMGPAGFRHGIVGFRIGSALEVFVRVHDMGLVGGADIGFWMQNGNLRSPDVSFIRRRRYECLSEKELDRFFRGAPDLAVEVLSPSDDRASLREKAAEYFESGASSVWIVDPDEETVTVLRPGCSDEIFRGEDQLRDEGVLPGFGVGLAEIFRIR